MRYRASVSFEHDTLPVKTYRGEVVAQVATKAATSALRAARSAFPYTQWRSVVVVLEKLDEKAPQKASRGAVGAEGADGDA